mmetsp:Transcript_162071/g.519673  ORF Transcript_162071/g.519673 Transcript_162071/m.519673 type:complete len:290 (-) Transcript_162071:179-1048(-)
MVLAHGKLLQVVVRLKEHLAHTRACQPPWLETLDLHQALVLDAGRQALDRVERKPWLATFSSANGQSHGKVLQVDGRGRVLSRRHAHGARGLLQHQAAEPRGGLDAEAQRDGSAAVARHHVRRPADAELCPPPGFLLSLCAPTDGLLIPHRVQHTLRHALAVHQPTPAAAGRVRPLAKGEAALRAQPGTLAVRVLLRAGIFEASTKALDRQVLPQRADLVELGSDRLPFDMEAQALLQLRAQLCEQLLASDLRADPAGLRPIPTQQLILQPAGRVVLLHGTHERASGEA